MADEETSKRRTPKDWPGFIQPVLLPVTGFRDQNARITYLPWSDVELGLIGWEVVPDRSHQAKTVLLYLVPNIVDEVFEIRCHYTANEPDPLHDRLLGSISFPSELLDPPG